MIVLSHRGTVDRHERISKIIYRPFFIALKLKGLNKGQIKAIINDQAYQCCDNEADLKGIDLKYVPEYFHK